MVLLGQGGHERLPEPPPPQPNPSLCISHPARGTRLVWRGGCGCAASLERGMPVFCPFSAPLGRWAGATWCSTQELPARGPVASLAAFYLLFVLFFLF